jgi:hypothetical protein
MIGLMDKGMVKIPKMVNPADSGSDKSKAARSSAQNPLSGQKLLSGNIMERGQD